jgi:hypothetical protein
VGAASVALTACATTGPCPPQADKVVLTKVLVPVPVACVDPKDIPTVPPLVGSKVNGNAAHDLLLVAPEAVDLRVALTKAVTLLDGCSAKP